MSKAQLRKELDLLSKEQLIDLTLDAYTARREVKEYFDFFLHPDARKLQDKYMKAIEREISRTKYQRMKCRVSVLKKALKDFASFDPGAEWVTETMVNTLLLLIKACGAYYYTETIANYAVKLLTDIIVTADRAAILDRHLPILAERIESLRGADYLKHLLRDTINNASEFITPLAK